MYFSGFNTCQSKRKSRERWPQCSHTT